MVRAWIVVLLVLGLAPALPTAAADATVTDLVLTVEGEPAHGLLAVPDGEPELLVVITHGYTHSAESHRAHLQALADRGVAAVAMDYRGSGFPLGNGTADTIAATEHLRGLFPGAENVAMFSVSMGAAVGAMTLTAMPDAFDFWFLSEPMANVAETYAEAKALSPGVEVARDAAGQIEDECGGGPVADPACLAERTAVVRIPEIEGLGLGSIVVHGVNDGLVPHNQGREAAAALRAHGVPTDFYTVLRGEPDAEGTTLTGHAGQNVDGLAGHGSERNDTHALTALSWELVLAWVDGDENVEPANREFVVDRDLGAVP